MSRYKRKGLLASLQEYIERITHPKNMEDLDEALKNPESLPYKKAIAMENKAIEAFLILKYLITHFIIEKEQASQQEKEAMYRWGLIKQIEEQEQLHEDYAEMQRKIADQQTANDKSMKVFPDFDELTKRLYEYPDVIQKLEDQIQGHQSTLKTLQHDQEQNDKDWQKQTHKQMTHYTNDLVKQNIHFIDAHGKSLAANGATAQQMLKHAYAAPPPSKVVSVVRDSLDKAQKAEAAMGQSITTKEESIPDAPLPPPRPMPAAKTMAVKEDVNKQIKLLSELAENKTGKALLEILLKNKAPLKQMVQSHEKEPTVECYAKALSLDEKIIATNEKLSNDKASLEKETQSYKQDKELYKQITHHTYHRPKPQKK